MTIELRFVLKNYGTMERINGTMETICGSMERAMVIYLKLWIFDLL